MCDRFIPLKKLGSGVLGNVYLVKDNDNGDLYALKTFDKKKSKEDWRMEILKREIKCGKEIKGPFLANMHYTFQTKSKVCMIIDLISGGEYGWGKR